MLLRISPALLVLGICLSGCTGSDKDTSPDSDTVEEEERPLEWDSSVSIATSTYSPCVSEAQCSAGDACTPVPGYDVAYCAPACDPAGSGAECQVDGGGVCLPSGRCAGSCDAGCPDGLACQSVMGEDVCAGEYAYVTCASPNVDNAPDCPVPSLCFHLEGVFPEGLGACLPYCSGGTCPSVGIDATAEPSCDILGGLCVLTCNPADALPCPVDWACQNVGGGDYCLPSFE